MKAAAQVFWPLTILVLLALFVFERRDLATNPLSAQPLETLFSVTRR